MLGAPNGYCCSLVDVVAPRLHLLHAKTKPPAHSSKGRGLAVSGACGGLFIALHPS